MTTNHQRDNAQLKLENALRVWANGDNSYVAGVELLIKHGRAIHPNAPWIRTDGDKLATINTETLIAETGAYSTGERQIFAIAASIINGHRVRLNESLSSLDHADVRLVLDAIATAAGFAEPTVGFERSLNGELNRVTLPSLVQHAAEPWEKNAASA